jgi:L-threonylcarbamoyladenylate synthase
MEIVSLTSNNFQKIVELAANAIKKGGVLIAPTDTVYGLLADATNEKAIKKIYAAKNRPQNKPLPIFAKNMAMAKKLAKISQKQQTFLEIKWPGKFTAIFKKNPAAKIFGAGDDSIALRIPRYPFINSLLETLNTPLCGTSANLSGQAASTEIDRVLAQFAKQGILPDIAINAGDLPASNPSTIVDMSKKELKIIRK